MQKLPSHNAAWKTVAWAFALLTFYQAIYASYLNPIFEYFHYFYHPRSVGLYAYTYVLALLPIAFHRHQLTPASFGASVIYVMCFAPGLLTMLFMWEQSIEALLASLTLLSISMCCLFWTANGRKPDETLADESKKSQIPRIHPRVRKLIFILTAISSIAILAENWSHMRFVGFADVYDLRSESRDATSGALVGYLTLWLSLCFIPYYATVGVVEKSRLAFLCSIALSLLIYTSSGAKSTLLMPVTIWAFHRLISSGRDFLPQLLKMFTILLLAMVIIQAPEFDVVKSLVVMRTLSTGGWTLTKYHEYFTQNGLTYYSHVGVVNSLTGGYPYGEYSLGQMIGIEYINSAEANFNANFWASDGFAALGVVGLIPATIGGVLSLRLVNHFGRSHDPLFVGLWLTGFWTALLNSPVPTSLLSGGGFLIMLLLALSRFFSNREAPNPSLPKSIRNPLLRDPHQAIP